MQAQVMHARKVRGLKYNKLAMTDLIHAKMMEEMKGFLMGNMEGEWMLEEVAEYWLHMGNSNWMEKDVKGS